ncbi:hypothetical protein DICVIV_09168 [Dictyocaulus viviparus]|uniref:DAN domain-containing protein n=1 Tax=Dictyocaulus viviparus TaxID=29172 RepID=A0A0D8XR35_DICVI|nr:hypothetical protein DICVIV_09168 [Dictyocaulus viviparus]
MDASNTLQHMFNYCMLSYRPILFIAMILLISSHHVISIAPKYHCRKVGAEEIIDERGCELVILRVNRCSGHCLSITFPNPITGRISVHAKCCRMTDTEWVISVPVLIH